MSCWHLCFLKMRYLYHYTTLEAVFIIMKLQRYLMFYKYQVEYLPSTSVCFSFIHPYSSHNFVLKLILGKKKMSKNAYQVTNSNTKKNSQIIFILSLSIPVLYLSMIKAMTSDVNWISLVPCLMQNNKIWKRG